MVSLEGASPFTVKGRGWHTPNTCVKLKTSSEGLGQLHEIFAPAKLPAIILLCDVTIAVMFPSDYMTLYRR